MRRMTKTADRTKTVECPFCRKVSYKNNKEYVIWPKEKADLKEENSGAMLNLGSHYYSGTMCHHVDKEKGVKLWRESAGALNNDQACLNLTIHYGSVLNDKSRALYFFKKGAILGNVEARCLLGKTSDTM